VRFRSPRHFIRPLRIVESITRISLDSLEREGVRGIVVDLDNTLVGWRKLEPSPEVADWVRRALGAGYAIAIVSNNVRAWVSSVATMLGVVTFVHRALKPLPFGIFRAVKQLRVARSEIIVIGDQLFADVLGAKLLGIRAILTEPIIANEHPAMAFVRSAERFMLKGARREEI